MSVQFRDVTREAGIHFVYTNAAAGRKYLLETVGPGCAFLDYDGDGFLDLYLVNGSSLPGFHPTAAIHGALYRNNRDGTFVDVTESAGVAAEGLYGMGVVAADYDNDGHTDLYITGYGRSILYHNEGNGTFSNVTAKAGVANAGNWGTSAAFFDYDNDGFLDLFVANYVDFRLENNIVCTNNARPNERFYCHPDEFEGVPSALYRNNRDGTFSDVSTITGIAQLKGKALGVVTADFNQDGFPDIYVANDSVANFLFLNSGQGKFREIGMLAGVAYNGNGKAQAGMGVAAGDYDGDGFLDILVTNLSNEAYVLYRNEGKDLFFRDVSFGAGVGPPSLLLTGWGVGFLDYDNDGDEDILAVNGHVMENVALLNTTLHYLQPALLLENQGARYVDVTAARGSSLSVPRASRGAAFGDFDNDGNIDVLVANSGGPPALLRNGGGSGNHWLTLQLQGKTSNRSAIGVQVKLTAGRKTQRKEILGGGSYLSSSDTRLHFGLGSQNVVEKVEIRWPSGKVQVFKNVSADRILRIVEGS